MISLTVDRLNDGKRLDRFLFSMLPDTRPALLLRAFKKRDVKINGTREQAAAIVRYGDRVTVFLPEDAPKTGVAGGPLHAAALSANASTQSTDESNQSNGEARQSTGEATQSSGEARQSTGEPTRTSPAATGSADSLAAQQVRERQIPQILYEDDRILVAVKPQGMLVRDEGGLSSGMDDEPTLEELLRAQYANSGLKPGFPELCHRLDRNTGGLVVLAKDAGALAVMERMFRIHAVRKEYRCVVEGIPRPRETELEAWLEKDSAESRVFIHDEPRRGASRIVTRYRTVASAEGLSMLNVEIITGRTHQIRAHLAWIGLAIAGDGKYGRNALNRRLHLSRQALWAWRLTFGPAFADTSLAALAGRKVRLDRIPWEGNLQKLFEQPPDAGYNESVDDGGG